MILLRRPAVAPLACQRRAIYISYYPDLEAPGATDAIQAFTDLAVRSGVRRLVLLSGRGEPEAQIRYVHVSMDDYMLALERAQLPQK